MITNSRATLSSLPRRQQIKAHVVYNVVDLPPVPAPRAFPLRPLVVTVGRLIAVKQVDVLVRAMAHLETAADLEILGDGPERPALMALAEQLGLGERVTFRGIVDRHQVAESLQRARLVVIPTGAQEGFCNAAAETLAAGTPLLCTDAGALPEVVADAATIVSVDVRPEELAALIDGVVSMSPAQWQERSERSRAQAKHFVPEVALQSLLDRYRISAGWRAPA